MTNLLKALYQGELSPQTENFNRNPAYGKAAQVVAEREQKLFSYLLALPESGESAQLLQEMTDAQIELDYLGGLVSFVQGFRLGAGLQLEVLFQTDMEDALT